ncbi:MAG: CocE/NonD family hydrolase [Candidatus Solibacter usitatus]|nr:CocE/NonD family hydrolase [Candidatus Solibacter usitatus]
MTRRLLLLPAFATIALWAQRGQPAPAPPDERAQYVRQNYTKYEFMVPVRDGVKLFTAVYVPKDKSQQYPIMLLRTPYSVAPYGPENYRGSLGPASEKFMREGFIFAYQDVRGKSKSEGTFMNVRPHNPSKQSAKDVDEASDTYDTIDWLVKNVQPNNGRVGMYGISYPGFYAAMGAIDSHPALKATSPQAPVINWFIGDDFHHNGALFLAHAFNFFGAFGRPRSDQTVLAGSRFSLDTPDAYDFHLGTGPLANYNEKHFKGQVEFWKELMEQDAYGDFWKARDPRPYVRNTKPAMMSVGGWFDAEDVYGPLRLYESAEKQSPGATNILVEGPWSHGGWARSDGRKLGNADFATNTSKFFQDEIEFPFFLWHLKGKGEGGKLPEAYVFETGRNEWHKLDAWPPKQAQAKTLYFQPAGKLAWSAPAQGAGEFDEYISDPGKPVPFTPYIANGMSYNYMTDDQRFAASRPDVLVYQTEPLESDVRIGGPLKATLYVSTSGTDSDWVVKLIDVFPADSPDPNPNPENIRMGGYQMLVRGEPFRGRFRKGFDKPEAFTPGKVEKIEFELPDVFHAFRRGHRIMVQVQSSWFPLTDRNPQKFVKISEAKAEDFTKATQRVYRTPQASSALTVLTLD